LKEIDAGNLDGQTGPAMPHLSWNEVRERAIRFSREHAGDRSESAEKQTFWNEFFSVFGLRRASLASFEANVTNIKGNKAAIDLLWKGRLLVEHKSFGEDLALAKTQAFSYIEDLTREDRWEEIPRFVLVSDFARFVLYDPNTMPAELRRAHAELDRAVEKCYRAAPFHSDRERVEFLFSLYEKLTTPLLPATPKGRSRRQEADAKPRGRTRQGTPALPGQNSPPEPSRTVLYEQPDC
jgi:hypothetical protein